MMTPDLRFGDDGFEAATDPEPALPLHTGTVRVLVIEDEEATRERIVSLVSRDPQFEVQSAGTLGEARRLIALGMPELVLSDLLLPDGHATVLIREITASSPAALVVVLSVFGDPKSVINAIQAGASGYLLKDMLADQLLGIVRKSLAGECYISPQVARYLVHQLQRREVLPSQEADRGPKLTPREVDILCGIAKGYRYADLAKALNVSSHTVPGYIKSIYRKLGVNSRSEAVFEATQLQLIRL
jgi:DNA-binding NarL/FixJ family response regulator